MNPIERIDSGIGRRSLYGVAATRRIEERGLAAAPPFSLMARAGDATARLALALAPHARHVRVFAGPGHNGGDGIECAVRLHELGKRVSLVLVAAADRLPPSTREALARATDRGIAVEPPEGVAASDADKADLVVDALLGIGASRPPAGAIAAAIERIAGHAARGARVLAVDVPSGLDADTGMPLGTPCVIADDTLTMLTLKPGLFTAAGRDHAGRVWLAGLDVDVGAEPADAWLAGSDDATGRTSPRRHAEHKGSFGDAAVVGGAPGMAGAAWLAGRAAHAAGAGRVFVDLLDATTGTLHDSMRPELMPRPGWWQGPLDVLAGSTVICGCGGGDAVRAALPRLLSATPRLVLDADALNALAADDSLRTLARARTARGFATILTPHPLEAARLLGRTTSAVQADRLRSAQDLAERYGAVVVLKGSGTVIAAQGVPPRIAATGNACLASAGTGDVLAGWIGGRWAADGARMHAPVDLATRCVVEHGAAAEPAAPGVLRASDLIEALYRRSRAG